MSDALPGRIEVRLDEQTSMTFTNVGSKRK